MYKLILASALAFAVLADVAVPTPAAAGWCIEACGLKRVPRQTTTVQCSTVSRRGYTDTVCTRS